MTNRELDDKRNWAKEQNSKVNYWTIEAQNKNVLFAKREASKKYRPVNKQKQWSQRREAMEIE